MKDILDMTVPIVVETSGSTERAYDIFSRLLKDRIVLLGSEVNDAVASLICAQLLFLESQDPEKEIYLYINSPGGSVTAGMAIYDTMNYITPPIATVCMGRAASMGAFLLSAGQKGMRYALPNSQVMIHQPLGGFQGQATDIDIHAREILRMRETLNGLLAKHTGQPIEKIAQDTERDNFMTAEMAQAYGLVDKVLASRRDLLAEKSESEERCPIPLPRTNPAALSAAKPKRRRTSSSPGRTACTSATSASPPATK